MTTDTNPAALATTEENAAAIVAPVTSLENVVHAFEAYAAAKTRLLQGDDYTTYRDHGQQKRFVNRSGWRKLAIAFNVTFEVADQHISYENPDLEEGIVSARFIVRAEAPNGRFVESTGYCSRTERCCDINCNKSRNHRHCPAAAGNQCTAKHHFSKPDHDIPATAETRAKNRAAADLFGMGEISAEEAEAGGGHDHPPEPSDVMPKLIDAAVDLIRVAIAKGYTDDQQVGRGRATILIGEALDRAGFTTEAIDPEQANEIWQSVRTALGYPNGTTTAAAEPAEAEVVPPPAEEQS